MTHTRDDDGLVAAFLQAVERLSQREVEGRVPGVSQSDVSRWRRGEWERLTAAKRRAIEDFLFADSQPQLESESAPSRVGHAVVRESGWVDYDPSMDPVATVMDDVQAILDWLPEDMSRRLSGTVSSEIRLAQVYAYGAAEGWSAERLGFVHATRQRLQELRQRQGSPEGGEGG